MTANSSISSKGGSPFARIDMTRSPSEAPRSYQQNAVALKFLPKAFDEILSPEVVNTAGHAADNGMNRNRFLGHLNSCATLSLRNFSLAQSCVRTVGEEKSH